MRRKPRKPHDAARAHFYENDARQWYNRHKDEVYIVQAQWWDLCPIYRVIDPQSGQIVDLSEKKWDKLKEQIGDVKHVKQNKKKYFQAFIAGPLVLEKGEAPWPDGFTLMCATGKRDAQKGDWFGVVRGLVDPQKWSNKFLSDFQDMIVSNRQGGAFVEESALIDPRKAEEDWNTSALIQLQDGAIARGAIMERTPPPLPAALDRMVEWCISSIPAVSGINQEFMGYADRDQPNVLEMQRKRAAINVLASLFSSLRKYRKDRARAVLFYIREYMNDGRLVRILGGDGKEKFIPLALDPAVEQYDIIIDEASSSPNQKEETFGVLMALLPHLVSAGVAPPVEIMDYLPLPSSFIAKWKEMLQPKPPGEEEQIAKAGAVAELSKDGADAEYKKAQAKKVNEEAESQRLLNEGVRLGIVPIEELG